MTDVQHAEHAMQPIMIVSLSSLGKKSSYRSILSMSSVSPNINMEMKQKKKRNPVSRAISRFYRHRFLVYWFEKVTLAQIWPFLVVVAIGFVCLISIAVSSDLVSYDSLVYEIGTENPTTKKEYGIDVFSNQQLPKNGKGIIEISVFSDPDMMVPPNISISCSASFYFNARKVKTMESSQPIYVSESQRIEIFDQTPIESDALSLTCDFTGSIIYLRGFFAEYDTGPTKYDIFTTVYFFIVHLIVIILTLFYVIGFSVVGDHSSHFNLLAFFAILLTSSKISYPTFVKQFVPSNFHYIFSHVLQSISIAAFRVEWVYMMRWFIGIPGTKISKMTIFQLTYTAIYAIILIIKFTKGVFFCHFFAQLLCANVWFKMFLVYKDKDKKTFKTYVLTNVFISWICFWVGYSIPSEYFITETPATRFMMLYFVDPYVSLCYSITVMIIPGKCCKKCKRHPKALPDDDTPRALPTLDEIGSS